MKKILGKRMEAASTGNGSLFCQLTKYVQQYVNFLRMSTSVGERIIELIGDIFQKGH